MYAVSHSLAHRGPGATRARARWQPYASPSPSVSSSRSSVSTTYLNTPASSVSSSPPSSNVSSISEFERKLSNPPTISQAPKELHFRDTQKGRYLSCLVDQTVKSLCEIWPPADIPVVFQTSARVPFCAPPQPTSTPTNTHQQYQSHHHTRTIQLPSPVSPNTPCSPSSQSSTSSLSDQYLGGPIAAAQLVKRDLVPLRNFVHEVLRRSRTSGCVLQTALCYLEAIRSKVPELASKERNGEGVRGEPESASRIISPEEDAEELGVTLESLLNPCQYVSPANSLSSYDEQDQAADVMGTVRIQDGCASAYQSQSIAGQSTYIQQSSSNSDPAMEGLQKKPKGPSAPMPPMPPLPSPLLCPRRAFLASLILASKFMQDKCYSNRAWAKLSGLHPREIGRCERALGDALEWRLWVGKMPVRPVPQDSARSRPVTRCRSESDLSPKGKSRDLPPLPDSESESFMHASVSRVGSSALSSWFSVPEGRPNILRRSSTVPVLPSEFVGEDTSYTSMDCQYQPAALVPTHQDVKTSFAPSSGLSSLASIFYEGFFSSSVVSSSWPAAAANTRVYQSMPRPFPVQDVSPPTPTLSFSPTSTESSSSDGDRTIQMTNLSDADVPTPLMQFPPLLGGGLASGVDVARNTVLPPFGVAIPMVVGSGVSQVQKDVLWHQAVAGCSISSGVLGFSSLGASLYQQ